MEDALQGFIFHSTANKERLRNGHTIDIHGSLLYANHGVAIDLHWNGLSLSS